MPGEVSVRRLFRPHASPNRRLYDRDGDRVSSLLGVKIFGFRGEAIARVLGRRASTTGACSAKQGAEMQQ